MKKASGILLIIAGGCVAVGVLLCVLSAALIAWNPDQWNTGDFHTVNHTVTDPYTSIRVEGTDSNIRILPATEGQKYQVVSYESENQPHTVRVENGTLIITQKDERKWQDHIVFFSFSEPKITIYVPETSYDSLYVEGDTGDVETHGALTFGNVNICLSTGDVTLKSGITGTLNVKTSTGDMKIRGINPTSVTLTATTGDIELANAKVEGDVSMTTDTGYQSISELVCRNLRTTCTTGGLSCHSAQVEGAIQFESDTGRISFSRVQCESITGETTTGDIICEDGNIDGDLHMIAGSGDITLTNFDADTLHITTDTGDVSGSLRSEKIFFTETNTGDIRVPKSTSGGVCEIKTDTGDITFTIIP